MTSLTDFNAIHMALLMANVGQFVLAFYLHAKGRPWHFAAYSALIVTIWIKP
jgi:hypothetical protein